MIRSTTLGGVTLSVVIKRDQESLDEQVDEALKAIRKPMEEGRGKLALRRILRGKRRFCKKAIEMAIKHATADDEGMEEISSLIPQGGVSQANGNPHVR